MYKTLIIKKGDSYCKMVFTVWKLRTRLVSDSLPMKETQTFNPDFSPRGYIVHIKLPTFTTKN